MTSFYQDGTQTVDAAFTDAQVSPFLRPLP